MSATVIPITESPALAPTPLSAGQLLSAKERGVVAFRNRLVREISGAGQKRTSDHVAGYRRGWDDCVDYLRSTGQMR